MSRWRRIFLSPPLIVLVLVLVFYSGAGFFLFPYLARHYGPKIVHERTGLRAVVGQLRFNPYTLDLEVKGVGVDGPDGSPMLNCDRLKVKLAWRSLVRRVWTFERVGLSGLTVRLVVGRDGGLNLARLVPPGRKPDKLPPPPSQQGPSLMVREFALDQARIEVLDQRPVRPAALGLEGLRIVASSLTTLPGREGKFSMEAKVREGGTVRLNGQLGLRPLAVTGDLALDGLEADALFAFADGAINLAPPAGRISLSTVYRLARGDKGWQAALNGLKFELQGASLRLKEDKAPLLTLPRLSLVGGMDLAARRVDIDQLDLEGGEARVAFNRVGELNWARIIPPPAPGVAAGGNQGPVPPAARRLWTVGMRELALKGLAVDYQDLRRSPGVKATIARLGLTLAVKAELGGESPQIEISQAELEAVGLGAGRAGAPAPMLALDRFKAAGGEFDLAAKRCAWDLISLAGGRIEVRRDAKGALNLAQLLPSPGKVEQKGRGKKTSGPSPPGRAARFLVKEVSVSGIKTDLFDELAVKRKAPLLAVKAAFTLKDVDGQSPMPCTASLAMADGGVLRASGVIHPAGPAVEGEIKASRINLAPLQPYLAKVSQAALVSGFLSAQGRLRYGLSRPKAENGYTGDLAIDDLRLTKKGEKETLIGWKALATKQMRLKFAPGVLEIGDLRLHGPEGKFVIGKDHRLNLASVFASSTGEVKAKSVRAAPVSKGESEAFRYRVRRLLIDDGQVDFADLSLFTPFGARIHGLKGVVVGVSSVAGSRATVQLDGLVDRYGEAKLRGALVPADPKLFTDLALDFRNLEMAKLTPYSGTFAGRRIDSGKLSVDLKYQIDHGELKGDNRFVVERLALGDKVKSPEAVSLPLDLAVALLKDSQGVIDLGLPVHGDLNSPEFSYGSLVWKALTNLFTKIVTSPFRLLGALLPGFGDENALKSVRFEAGSREVPPPEREKLASLAQALSKRPQLILTITGGYNPKSDREELQRWRVARDLDALLGQPPLSADDPGPVDFANPETEKGLRRLFARRFGDQALGRLGREAKASGAAGREKKDGETEGAQLARLMFERLAAGESPDDQELTKLAETRAQAVAAELTQADGVAKERLAIQPAQALAPQDPVAVKLDLRAGR